MHRVTYASPLCGQRSQIINDMLGLPGVTQPPVTAESLTGTGPLPVFIDVPPSTGGGGPTGPGPTGPGPIVFPGGPLYPPGPGPIIIVSPPGPPVTPPVSTPVPEPASWATMLIGMMLIGSLRRRGAKTAAQ